MCRFAGYSTCRTHTGSQVRGCRCEDCSRSSWVHSRTPRPPPAPSCHKRDPSGFLVGFHSGRRVSQEPLPLPVLPCYNSTNLDSCLQVLLVPSHSEHLGICSLDHRGRGPGCAPTRVLPPSPPARRSFLSPKRRHLLRSCRYKWSHAVPFQRPLLSVALLSAGGECAQVATWG